MSTVAIPFDSPFGMGPRQSYTWPTHMDANTGYAPSSLMSSDLSSISGASDPSLTPPSSARSLNSSPSRSPYSLDSHDLSRRNSAVRRSSKVAHRMSRAESHSYMDSPPMTIPDAPGSMALPVYSSAPSYESHPSYYQSYNGPVGDSMHPNNNVFSPSYSQPMQHHYNAPAPIDYSGLYGSTPDYNTRASSISSGSVQENSMPYQVSSQVTSSSVSSSSDSSQVRVVQSRPKPRCWEHGCNGRQFSTFSNLLRHQREKSGQAAKASCPNCGAEFTRTTARNGHLLHDKCKQRRSS